MRRRGTSWLDDVLDTIGLAVVLAFLFFVLPRLPALSKALFGS